MQLVNNFDVVVVVAVVVVVGGGGGGGGQRSFPRFPRFRAFIGPRGMTRRLITLINAIN